jgi:hypothetical protein
MGRKMRWNRKRKGRRIKRWYKNRRDGKGRVKGTERQK